MIGNVKISLEKSLQFTLKRNLQQFVCGALYVDTTHQEEGNWGVGLQGERVCVQPVGLNRALG